jgi:peptide/nickel transport system substrate-binding protein
VFDVLMLGLKSSASESATNLKGGKKQMFGKKNLVLLLTLSLILVTVAVQCGPAPTPEVIEKVVKETVVVEKEVEKEVVVEVEVTKIVAGTPETIIVTATPEPEPTEPPLAEVAPDFRNPDTYMVITGAGEPESMDPAWTYETAGSAVQNNIYEALVWFNRERTDSFVPSLATEWEVNETGDVWTFQLREGVTFHKGGTLEPHDVAYSIQRGLLQDRTDGPHWMTLEAFFGMYTIEDVAMSLSGAESFDAVSDADLVKTCEMVKEAIVADDEAGTVTWNLYQPTPWFLAMLANSFMGAVVDMEWMVENGAWDGECDNWVQWHDPAAEETILFNDANGTGPYVLDHWTPGEEIVLVANENYWQTEPQWEGVPGGPARIKRVVIKNIPEWGTRLAMFEAGDADWIYVPPPFRAQLEPYYQTICYPDESCEEGNPDGYMLAYRDLPRPVMTPAQLNWQINNEGGNPFIGSGELDGNGIPPDFFQDEHARRAFNYCFDFDALIVEAMNGDGMQAQGPIIAGMMGYREGEDPLFSYDLAKCEEEFKQAWDGQVWENGFYLQVSYNTGNETRRIASEILKAGVEAVNPNFTVNVVGMPWPVLLNSRRQQKLPIYVGGWLEDFHDPHNWVHPFLHSAGAYGRVINMPEDLAAEFDELIEKAASLTTAEERRPVYEEIQLKAQEEAVVIWMYQEVDRVHLQPWIKGYYFNPAYSGVAYSWVYALSKETP